MYFQRTEQVTSKADEQYQLQNVPGLLPYKKVKPTETVRRRITDVHGSLKATEVRALIEKKEEEEQQKKVRKEELELRKAESKEQFIRCREACVCKAGVCARLECVEQWDFSNAVCAKMFRNHNVLRRHVK